MFTIGLFDKCTLTPWAGAWTSHYSKLAQAMVRDGFNTLLLQSQSKPEHALHILDILLQHELKAVITSGNPLNSNWDFAGPGKPFHPVYTHPAVVAIRYGDEPKTADDLNKLQTGYGALRAHYTVPIITAFVGEGMTGTEQDYAYNAWQTLAASTLFARCYPVRKDKSADQAQTTTHQFARIMRDYADYFGKPWWAIVQGHGEGVGLDVANYWRYPTVGELRAQLFSVVTAGASGVFVFGSVPFENYTHAIYNANLEPTVGADGAALVTAVTALRNYIDLRGG